MRPKGAYRMPAKNELCRKCKRFGATYICEKCLGCEACCDCSPDTLKPEQWKHRDSRAGLVLARRYIVTHGADSASLLD